MMTVGLLALVGALAAVAVASVPASAAEFKASGKEGQAFPLKLKGEALGPQVMEFGSKIHVTCPAAKVKGTIASPASETLEIVVAYHNCEAGPVSAFYHKRETVGMKFKEKAILAYHSHGFVVSNEEVEMKAQFLKCLVDWVPGTYPKKAETAPGEEYTDATYTNKEVEVEPGVKQHRLVITNALTDIEWGEEGGGFCEKGSLAEGEKGRYAGQLEVQVPKGNIEFG